jgi:chemotaxis protein methyltransferase CheR
MNSPVQPDTRPEALARLVTARTGLSRVELRPDQLERIAGLPQPPEGSEAGAPEWDALIDEVTVRETYFFRHAEHFEALRKHVLPELRARKLLDMGLRAWSAGCASGEEAYSLVMLLAEEGLLERSHVLATDISRAAIERGRAASYRDWSVRALASERLRAHFERSANMHVVRNHLKSHVTFRQLNLAEDCYPAAATQTCGLQLIFCRNVLMFLNAATRAAIAGRLFNALTPGGFLVTGPTDPNVAEHASFEVQLLPGVTVYRKPLASYEQARESIEPALADESDDLLPPTAAIPRRLSMPPAAPPAADESDLASVTRAIRETWNARGPEPALDLCVRGLERSRNELELHYLRALLLWELQLHAEAARAMRRVLYLDRSHALAHFGLGSIYEQLGDVGAARRSYRNALATCEKLAPETILPFGDGLAAVGLARAAEHGLRRLAAADYGDPA